MSDRSLKIIPVFITHLGCPHDCAFCNQKQITGVDAPLAPEDLSSFVEIYLDTMSSKNVGIAFYGGSFTGLPVALQEKYLAIAKHYRDRGAIQHIRLSTRPDYVDEATVMRLIAYQVDLVELGCQSFDDAVLNKALRGHNASSIDHAVDCLKKHGLAFGIQLMPGLKGDSYDTAMASVNEAIRLKPTCVRLYPAVVIKNTVLEDQFESGSYVPWTLQQAVEFCAEAFLAFERNGIAVIRLGLQNTDLIHWDGFVVAGPFHPAFGALVKSEVYYRAISKVITPQQHHIISVHPSHAMYVVGQEQMNIKRWHATTVMTNVKLVQDLELPLYSFQMNGQNRVNIME